MSDLYSDVIYHYCSTDTFIKIIENKTIRLSNIFKMNDDLEIQHVLLDLEEQLLDFYKKNPINLDNLKYNDKTGEEAISKLVGDITNEIVKLQHIIYIACFSNPSKCDNKKQWDNYGDRGHGVSIGFNKKILHDMVEKIKEETSIPFLFDMTKIEYTIPDTNNKNLDFMKKGIAEIIFKILNSVGSDTNVERGICTPSNAVLRNILSDLSEILTSAVRFKIEKYKNEDECRLYLTTNIDSIYPEECLKFNNDIKCGDYTFMKQRFINKDNKLVSYVDFYFGESNIYSNLIKEIVIGPKSKIDEKDIDLKMLLKNNKFEIKSYNIRASTLLGYGRIRVKNHSRSKKCKKIWRRSTR